MLIGRGRRALLQNVKAGRVALHIIFSLAVLAVFSEISERHFLSAGLLLVMIKLGFEYQIIAGVAVADDVGRKVWVDMLTDRIFIDKLLRTIAAGGRPDADALFQEATKAAAEDMRKADEEADPGLLFQFKGWRSVASAGRVVAVLLSWLVWVGLLGWVGSQLNTYPRF